MTELERFYAALGLSAHEGPERLHRAVHVAWLDTFAQREHPSKANLELKIASAEHLATQLGRTVDSVIRDLDRYNQGATQQ